MRRPAAALLVAASLAATTVACHREVPADMDAPGRTPADATYRTRAVVYGVPEEAGGELVLFHEAVPEFVDREGERSGMDSMAMPFDVADPALLEGIEKGDKVEAVFELRWKGDPTLLVTELRELPPETELRLGQSAPSADEADGAAAKGSSEAI